MMAVRLQLAVWRGFVVTVFRDVWEYLAAATILAIAGPVLTAIFYFLLRPFYLAFKALRVVRAARKAVARVDIEGVQTEGAGFWLQTPIIRPKNYAELKGSSIPIMMIGATKGGVGKTTLAGGLAAHFAMRWTQRRQDRSTDKPLRVLVIDQDFQGSFTTMTVHADFRYLLPSKANKLVSGELGKGALVAEAQPPTQSGMVTPLTIWTIPAYYDLAQAENRMLVEWLLPLDDRNLVSRLLRLFRVRDPDPTKEQKDVRYLLAEALLDPKVQQSFDLVIIDSPPRLTTSHIQAMCAATHILIPTILDGLSGDAVARYLDQIATHKYGPKSDASGQNRNPHMAICPHIEPIAIVCSMVPNVANKDWSGPLKVLTNRVAEAPIRPHVLGNDLFVRQRTPYRDAAGELIAYASKAEDQAHRELRAEVDQLAGWIAPKLGAESKGWKSR